jgi:peptide/nickel transport system substrate-binding protein
VNYAVDRAAIARTIFRGMVPPATQSASRNNPDYDPDLKGYPYDPAKAKALLTAAGYPNGFSFAVEMSAGTSGGELPAAMQQVASDLAKIGVKMEIRPLPLAQWQRNTHLGDFQSDAFNFEYETLPTGDTLRPYRLHSCTAPHPWYCDQAIMPMITEAKATFDPTRRSVLMKQILARTDEQAPAIFLFESLGLDGVSPKVENYSQDNGIIPFARISIKN